MAMGPMPIACLEHWMVFMIQDCYGQSAALNSVSRDLYSLDCKWHHGVRNSVAMNIDEVGLIFVQ